MPADAAAQLVTVETKGAKIIGVIALVLAVVAIFMPFVGIWVGILSCLLAIYPAMSRFGRVWALCTSIINAINALLLTPTFWISLGLASVASNDAQRGRMGADEASVVFSFIPWLWIICFVGLFALAIFKYATAQR